MVSTQSDNNQCSGGSSWRQPRIIIISDLGLRIDCLVHCQLILIIRSALKHNFDYSWKHFYYNVTNFLSQARALLGSVAQGSPLKCVALPLMVRQSHETGKLFPCQAKNCQAKDCQTKAAPFLAPDSRCRRPPGALRIWPQNVFLLSFPPGGQLFLLTALRSRSLFVLASLPAKSINPNRGTPPPIIAH